MYIFFVPCSIVLSSVVLITEASGATAAAAAAAAPGGMGSRGHKEAT